MRLPSVEKAAVPKEKITEYLLSREHWAGRSKARFFLRLGFRPRAWRKLADTLLEHAAANEVENVEKTIFGEKYIIEGEIETPSGKRPVVRAVWFIGRGESDPRFVTAYPVGGREQT